MGKYDPLDRFFAELAGDSHAWSFDEFERLTGVELPPSARRHAEWWGGPHYYAIWREHGWFVSPRMAEGSVRFTRTPPRRGRPAGSPERPRPLHGPAPSPVGDLILLGCVAQKHPGPAPAKDLYASPLWHRRRRYAEASGRPWAILSAEFGLLEPERVIPYYDRYLERESHEYRRAWSERVATEVVAKAEEVGARSVEIHAGAAYVESGLRKHLEAADVRVLRPTAGLRIGEQLAWYGGGTAIRPPADAPGAVLPTGQVQGAPPPRLVEARETGPFEYRWPDAVERFDSGWDGRFDSEGRVWRFRHAVGWRRVYGAFRCHTVTFLDGMPAVEGVAADDFEWSRFLLSLIKTPSGAIVRRPEDIPPGYENLLVVSHRSEIRAPYSRNGLAVKIRLDDLAAWAHHAVLRRLTVGGLAGLPPRPAASPERQTWHAEPTDSGETAEGSASVVAALLAYGEALAAALPPEGQLNEFTPDPAANQFVSEDPLAFLVAVVADYQIRAERAWALPYLLAQRLGKWGSEVLAASRDQVRAAFEQRPALHRFTRVVADHVVDAAQRVLDDWGGNAGAIWGDRPTAEELQRRLRAFDGISQKKAAMAVEILERDLGVPIVGMHGSDIAFDVHVRRVFLRTGLAERDDVKHMVARARQLYPKRPGALDNPAWAIGRTWCRPRQPDCETCPLGRACPRLLARARGVKGA